MNDPLLEDEIDTEEEDTDGPDVNNFVSDPIITLKPKQVLPENLQRLVDDTKQIIQERRDKMFGVEETPQPNPEPEKSLQPTQGPKQKLPSINFTEQALEVLKTAPDLQTGFQQLAEVYDSAEWDDPQKATQTLDEYGTALRQKFRVSTLPEDLTFDFAPIKPAEIASPFDDPVDNTIDRTQKWKEANLKALDETTDPSLIAKRDLLKRSIIATANKTEGEIRGKSRDEYYAGFISNLGLNAAKGLINPFHELATGKQYTGLERYLDPARAEGISTDVGMITGGVAGFLGVAGAAAAGGAAPLAAGLVAGASQGVGPVMERYNFIEDETGSSDQALTGALIEAGAQIAYNVPAGFLAGKAIRGTKSFFAQTAEEALKKDISEKALQGVARNAFAKELGEGFVTGVGGAGVGTILTNESLRVGLDTNDISLFQGLDKSLIYGGLLGVGAGYMGGQAAARDAVIGYAIKNAPEMKTSPVDTALYAQEMSAKGKQADIDRATGRVTTSDDRLDFNTETDGNTVPRVSTPKENIIGEGTPRKKGKKTVIENDGTTRVVDTESPIPKPDEFRDLDFSDDIEIPRPRTDEIVNYDKSINGDDFVTVKTEGVAEDLPTVSAKGGMNELADKILIFSGKTFKDLEMAPGGLSLLNHTVASILKDPDAFSKLVKFMPQKPGLYGQSATNFVDTPYIRISKELFSDPIKFMHTASHEIGHVIDYLNSYINTLDPKTNSEAFKVKPLINRLTQVKNQFSQPEGLSWKTQKKAEEQAKAVSAEMRGEWRNLPENSPHRAYRDEPAEIFADVFSAWAVRPDILSKYPDLVRALDDGFDRLGRRDPGLKRFYDWYKANRNNSNWVQQIRNESRFRVRQAGLEKENLTNKLAQAAEPTAYARGVAIIKNLYTTVFDKMLQLNLDVRQMLPSMRPVAEGWMETIRKNAYVHDFIFEKITQPVKHLLEGTDEAFKTIGVDSAVGINDIATYLEANKLKLDSTQAIELIKADPDRFKRAMAPLLASLDSKSSDLSIRPFLRDGYIQALEKAVADADPEAFVNVMARMSFETQLAGEELTPLASRKKAKEAKRTISNSKEVLRRIKKVQKLFPEFKDDLSTLFDPNSYRVRRYIANREGDVIFNANEDIANLQAKYGDNFKIIENFSKDFYRIMATLDPFIESSGLYSPEVIAKIKVNKDSYVTNAALEYFTSYSNFGPQIKAAMGSLKNTIDPISATIAKKNAMIVAAAYQTSENALVNFARAAGYEVIDEGVRSAKEIYKSKARLQKDSPRDAFLVEYVEGKPSLYRVKDGKLLEASIRKTESGPAVEGVLSLIEAGNKLFMIRELRTAYSPAFVFLQKYRDRKREFLSVLSNETFNPIKAAKIVYDINFGKEGTKAATKEYFESGGNKIQSGLFTEALDNQVNPNPLYGYGAPERNFNLAIEKLGELYGRPAEPDSSFAARIHDVANRKLLESNILGRNIKRGAEFIKSIAEQDEFRAKTNGYYLAKRYGMSDANAAHFARLGFGNPDPRGGGTASTQLNQLFLFGRAYLNGIRSMGLHLSTNPKQALFTQMLYVVAPKLFVTAAGASLIGQLYGEEAGEIYGKWVQKVSSFDKQSKLMLPVGFQDNAGNLKLFGEVTSKDIGNGWKAVGIGIPQDPIETDVAKFAWPFIDEVLNDWTGNLRQKGFDSITNVGTSMVARINPALLWMYNLTAFSVGKEPYDLYRNKGIYPKDIQLGGSFLDKAGYFAGYQASQMAPSVFPFNPTQSSSKDATSIFEDLQNVPVAGPLQRSVLRISNYGEVEKAQNVKSQTDAEKASFNLSVDDSTAQVKELARKASALVSFYGKDRIKEMNKTEQANSKLLLSWNRKFPELASEIRNAEETGNDQLAARLRRDLERLSAQTLAKLKTEPQ